MIIQKLSDGTYRQKDAGKVLQKKKDKVVIDLNIEIKENTLPNGIKEIVLIINGKDHGGYFYNNEKEKKEGITKLNKKLEKVKKSMREEAGKAFAY